MEKTNIGDVDLWRAFHEDLSDSQTILSFYEEHLCKQRYIYELDSPEHPLVKIRFEPDQMCHLLGMHYIPSGKLSGGKSASYRLPYYKLTASLAIRGCNGLRLLGKIRAMIGTLSAQSSPNFVNVVLT